MLRFFSGFEISCQVRGVIHRTHDTAPRKLRLAAPQSFNALQHAASALPPAPHCILPS